MKRYLLHLILFLATLQGYTQKRTYEYDDLNRLSKVYVYNGTTLTHTVTYNYDEMGNRLSKVVSSSTTPTQTIVISSPTSGTFTAGQSVLVSYASSGGTTPVSLELVSCTNATAIAVIGDGVVASGTVNYTLPSNLTAGQYRIKAYVTGSTGTPYYGTCFTVNPIATQTIAISSPISGTFNAGQSVSVSYASTGGSANVSLELVSCSGTASVGSIANGVAASGSVNYTLPSTLTAGQYRIKAYVTGTTGQEVYGSCFTVNTACSTPTATLSGTQSITEGLSATLSLALTGASPWSVVINGVTYSNITSSPYNFSVSPSTTTTYTVSSVSNACGSGTVSGSATVTVNRACSLNITGAITNASCGNANGNIVVTVTGQSGVVTYSWSNGVTTKDLTNISQGTYFLTATDGACSVQKSFDVGIISTSSWSVVSTVALPASIGTGYNTMGRLNDKFIFLTNYKNLNQISFGTEQITGISTNLSTSSPNYGIGRLASFNLSQPSTTDKIILSTRTSSGTETQLHRIGSNYNVELNNVINSPSISNGPLYFVSLAAGSTKTFGVDAINSNTPQLWKYDNLGLLSTEVLPSGSYDDNCLKYNYIRDEFLLFKSRSNWVRVYDGSSTNLKTTINTVQLLGVRGLQVTNGRYYIWGYNSSGSGVLEIYESSNYQLLNTIHLTNLPNNAVGEVDNMITASTLFIPSSTKVEVINLSTNTTSQVLELGASNYGLYYELNSQKLLAFTSGGFKFIKYSSASTLDVSGTVTDTPIGQNIGAINLSVTGGAATFLWSNGAATKDITNLTAGTYTVTITPSAGGCPIIRSFKVNIIPTQTIAISSPTSGTFTAGQSIAVTYASSGGTSPVSLELVSCTGTTANAVIGDGVSASGTISYTLPSNLATGQYRIKAYVTGTTGTPYYGSCFDINAIAAQTIAISSPISGTFGIGQNITVTYASTGGSANVSLELVSCTGTSPLAVIADGVAATGSLTYSLPNNLTDGQYRIKAYVTGTTGQGYYGACITVNAGSDCPPSLTHSGTILANTYQASQTIVSTADVSTNTKYYAGQSVTLLPGFEVGPTENFEIKIQGCATVPTNGLVAYYSFDSNSNDGSGNTNHLISTGTTSTVADRKNQALKAAGYGGNTSVGYQSASNSTSLQFATGFSVSLWYKLPSYAGMDGFRRQNVNGYQILVAKEGDRSGFYIGVSNDLANNKQSINFTNIPSSGVTNFNITASPDGTAESNLNKWIHLVVTAGDGNVKIFIDGVLKNTASVSSMNFSGMNSKNLFLGTMQALGTYWYPYGGALDEVRIYNRTLSNAEANVVYNLEKP